MSELEIPIQRVSWRDGQTLASRDLNDTERNLLRLRCLHNLYMHGVASGNWGIVSGFSAALISSGDAVAVSAGYALDSRGRELILSENVIVPVPPTASGWWVLVIRYQETPACRGTQRYAACENFPLGPKWELPAFVWLEAADLSPGRDVPLGAAHIVSGIVQPPVISMVRRIARPVARYKLVSGVTAPFQTAWIEPATVGPGWFETSVDTSHLGFVRSPMYFASLRGLVGDLECPFASALSIVDATPESFAVRVITGLEKFGIPGSAKAANQQGWTVSWLGFEADPEPQPKPLHYIHLSGFAVTNVVLSK